MKRHADFDFERWADDHGWAEQQQVTILLNYIRAQDNDDAFADYCQQTAEDDDE